MGFSWVNHLFLVNHMFLLSWGMFFPHRGQGTLGTTEQLCDASAAKSLETKQRERSCRKDQSSEQLTKIPGERCEIYGANDIYIYIYICMYVCMHACMYVLRMYYVLIMY